MQWLDQLILSKDQPETSFVYKSDIHTNIMIAPWKTRCQDFKGQFHTVWLWKTWNVIPDLLDHHSWYLIMVLPFWRLTFWISHNFLHEKDIVQNFSICIPLKKESNMRVQKQWHNFGIFGKLSMCDREILNRAAFVASLRHEKPLFYLWCISSLAVRVVEWLWCNFH